MKKKRVLLGMSGGVDSSAAAYLLREDGYEVVGATMKLWLPKGMENTAIQDAQLVADHLGVEFHVIDFEEKFVDKVVNNFIGDYFKGETPNPCVYCNKYIKFDLMYKVAEELNCDYVATGHYATIEFNEERNLYELKKAKTDKKDQTYMLYNMNQEKLAKTLFPIGGYEKDEIREIAKSAGITIHNKPDSQDICFIPDGDYEGFLKKFSGKNPKKGKFVDSDGKVLGEHQGLINYTIGQRKGLGITFGKPTYVISINGKDNTITLGDNKDLFKTELIAKDVNLLELPLSELRESIMVEAKVRYSARPSRAILTKIDDNRVRLDFENPQRAITKGQSVVFYDGRRLLGGGIIE